LNEWKATHPIMPLRLFADAGRSGAAVARLLFAGTGIAFFFFTTQFLQGVYGWSALEAGVAFLPMTLLQFAVVLGGAGVTHFLRPKGYDRIVPDTLPPRLTTLASGAAELGITHSAVSQQRSEAMRLLRDGLAAHYGDEGVAVEPACGGRP
ncbi:hypothetical protein IAE22_31240, partial [Bacillus sp. S34]|nr:hypothetical protein [Bacillus sp. S34]